MTRMAMSLVRYRGPESRSVSRGPRRAPSLEFPRDRNARRQRREVARRNRYREVVKPRR